MSRPRTSSALHREVLAGGRAAMSADLPPHEILGEIGRSSFGVVHRARDLAGREAALTEIVAPGLSGAEADALLEEIGAAAVLRHPHVLQILGAGLRAGRPCFLTPAPAGGRLSQRREAFRNPRFAAGLVEKLARAVAAAHAHGLLHGDLDPDGVLFDEDDQPMIGPFGVAPFLLAHAAPAVAAWVRGRPAYRAPEWFTTPPVRLEPTADVWSLGAVLYELLTGRRPFDGGDAEAIMRRITAEEPVAPRRLHRDLDRELEAVVLRCLRKRPDDRYGSARALADDLERWLRAEPTEARPELWWGRLLRAL